MIKKDIVVLGGGASAMFMLATTCSKKDILVIDKNTKLGKKILVTGNGRCNLTNKIIESQFYNTDKVMPFFKKYGQKETLSEFSRFGLLTYSDEEGRFYPVSNTASSVMDILKIQVDRKKNIQTMLETEITGVKKADGGYIVSCGEIQVFAKKLVIALGGKSGEKIFGEMGVKYIPYKKSLCGLKTETNKYLAGVRVDNAVVTLKVGNKEYKEVGEILFKEDGISGIVIFNLSRFLAYNNTEKAELKIDLISNITEKELEQILTERKQLFSDLTSDNFFTGIINPNLAKNILAKANIKYEKPIKDLSIKDILKFVHLLKKYELEVKGLQDNNQVYSGGVDLDCLKETLEHKDFQGLYFMGECINVDATCGGYNLQWAWTSAKIVGENI